MHFMKPNRNETIKYRFLILLLITALLLLACFITLLINFSRNKSMFYLIFIILSIYSILIFFYGIICDSKIVNYSIKYNVKIIYLLFFIVNIILLMLSFFVL